MLYGVPAKTRDWWDLAPGMALGFDPQDDAERFAADIEAAPETGLTMHTLRYYDRLALLTAHRDDVQAQLTEVTSHLRANDRKIGLYEGQVGQASASETRQA